MNLSDNRYSGFSLCLEMLETVDIIRKFNPSGLLKIAGDISSKKNLMITGEGSSRIFPAKNALYNSLKYGTNRYLQTEGCLQAMEYNLNNFNIIGLSNSGRTKELLLLFEKLKDEGHQGLFSVTSYVNSPVTGLSISHVLDCKEEKAVAATKSVVEQALVLQLITIFSMGDNSLMQPQFKNKLRLLADDFGKVLTNTIHGDIIQKFAGASKIYFAGRNNGVAEELALKTIEITRKKAMFLEGTFLLHGIEEVMQADEMLVLIDPWPGEENKIRKVMCEEVGLTVVAISSHQTLFPTIRVPKKGDFTGYTQLAAGWNLLTEVGLQLGIDIDRGLRARKIGNEG